MALKRRIVPKPRERNGRTRRDQSEAAAAIAAERAEKAALAVVLAQPHRRSAKPGEERDQRRITPVGRMILDGKVSHPDHEPATLFRAADAYVKLYALRRWVANARVPYGSGGYGDSVDLTPERRVQIERAWSDVVRELRECPSGERVTKAMELAILDKERNPDFDERTFGTWIPLSLSEGLAALATMWGMSR